MVEAVHLSIEKFGNFLLLADSKQHLLVKASDVLMNVPAKNRGALRVVLVGTLRSAEKTEDNLTYNFSFVERRYLSLQIMEMR